ncbi:PH domain-containing protein [Demequina sp. SO4-18]|uniref:PH domain-containing protein n=1 Tax=Demequina sp. SO4-18 TaxID=3401026 RepID=UPI003B5C9022
MTGESEPTGDGAPEQTAPRIVYRAPREWKRVHPISPLLGGWAVLGVVGSIMLYNYAPNWAGPDEGMVELAETLTSSLGWFALGAVVILALTLGAGYLQWRVNMYRLGDEAVQQRKGILFRQQRQARLDRLQAVDVVQPLLARFFGFAELRIEVAGGENSGIVLEYLRLGDAEAMRNELLALAAGVKRAKAAGQEATVDAVAGSGTAADAGAADADKASLRDIAGMPAGDVETQAAPEREIYAVPLSRLALSIVLTGPFIFLVSLPIIVGLAVLLLPLDLDDVVAMTIGAGLFTVLPAVFGLLGFFWSRLNSGFGFKAALSPDGIRLRHGALETRRQTVPPGRVQAVRFQQTLLWRRKDWWRVTINVAGYQDEQENVSTLLPVGSRQDALTALWLVLPDLGDPDPAGTVSTALSGTGDEHGFTASSTRARLFDPIQWRQRGVRATDRALMIRRGRLSREMFVVPHERTQSLQLRQGPWEKRRGLASFVVHSTNGPVKPVAEHLDVEDGIALLESQSKRAAEGRRRQTPEQWMSAVGISE